MNEVKNKATFTSKPSPVFPSYRPMLRIGQNLLVLKLNSNGNKASLLKLHLFSWGFKELKNLGAIQSFVMSNSQERIRFFGIEPTLNRALSLAIYDGLIDFKKGMYILTSRGNLLAEKILNNPESFLAEKPLLISIGKNPTEYSLTQLQKFWKNA
jgi:hypothetical protein